MDINWYGLSCFRIRESGVTVICDPYDRKVGVQLPRIRADIVTVSHDRPGHNAADRVTGDFKVLSGPGEYEVQNVFITAATTYHRTESDGSTERNTIFFFDFGNFTVGHLGDMGQPPTQSDIEELNIGDVDVLMVPVGGNATLDATRAVEVINMFEPKIVIPMHFQQPELNIAWMQELDPVDKFLRELGVSTPEPQESLRISKSSLPEETEVALFISGHQAN